MIEVLFFEVCERTGCFPEDCGDFNCEYGCRTKTVEVVRIESVLEWLRDPDNQTGYIGPGFKANIADELEGVLERHGA